MDNRDIIDMMRDNGVRFNILDFDKACERDLIRKKGFIINERALKKGVKNKNGIQSSLFGTDWDDEDSFAERYRCECGDLKGRTYMDEVCPRCDEPVKFKDVDYEIFGWICLDGYRIIHPLLYKIIETAIGTKNFEEIIKAENPIDLNGHLVKNVKHLNIQPRTPFYNIGINEFERRFFEIMVYFKNRKDKKDKKELFDFILENKSKVFTSCIPVCSSVLRPFMIKGDILLYNVID